MRDKITRLAAIVQADPGVSTATVYTGGGGGRGTTVNTARMFVALKPRHERDAGADEIITRLRPKLARVPGATLYLQAVQDIRLGGRRGNAQYQYSFQADSLKDLSEWAPKMLAALHDLPELRDVSSDQQDAGLQVPLTIDRATAARLGVSTRLIDETLYSAFGQRQVSTIYTSLNQYQVVMEVAPEFWQSPEALRGIYVRSTTGAQVPLTALTRFEPTAAPLQVNHQGLFPAVTISFNLAPGVALGDAVTAVESAARRIGPLRMIVAGRAFHHAFYQDSARYAVAGGAVLRLSPWLSIAGDYATLVDRVESERPAWGAGVQLTVPYTPHSMSIHATNVGTGSLEGASRGSHTRWGFEYTVPITLRRYAPRRSPGGVVADADARRAGAPANQPAAQRQASRAPDTVVVTIRQFRYERDTIRVKVGDVVVWRNADQLEHTVTADSSAFESPLIKPGQAWSHQFMRAGRFAYHCTPHPFMKMVVEVTP